MGKHIVKGLQPLLSKLSDMVCAFEDVHTKLKSSKLHLILAEQKEEDFENIVSEWKSQISDAIGIFTSMTVEIEKLEKKKR
jgi:hypothetical protein